MALKHFLFTIPMNALALTVLFVFIFPFFGIVLQYYEMFVLIAGVNTVVTVIAILLIKDGPKRGVSK